MVHSSVHKNSELYACHTPCCCDQLRLLRCKASTACGFLREVLLLVVAALSSSQLFRLFSGQQGVRRPAAPERFFIPAPQSSVLCLLWLASSWSIIISQRRGERAISSSAAISNIRSACSIFCSGVVRLKVQLYGQQTGMHAPPRSQPLV